MFVRGDKKEEGEKREELCRIRLYYIVSISCHSYQIITVLFFIVVIIIFINHKRTKSSLFRPVILLKILSDMLFLFDHLLYF